MNGGEFRRKAKRFADRKGLAYRWVPARGVGSHGTVYIGSRKTFAYPAWFRPDEDRRPVVSFPDFPHAHTDGRDMRDAMEEAIDCLGSVVAQYMAEKAEIPFPSAPKRGQKLVPVPLWIAGKLGLYLAMCEKGMNNSELARRLGVGETVVRRMLDPDHDTKTKKLQAALEVLGKRIVVGVEDVA